ncbi:MAG: LCP family protein [Bacilli bacterium]|nr:LCP family protein [Bacilli bacterium]
MSKKKKKLKKKNIIIVILAIISLVASIFSVYSLSLLGSIESVLRLTLAGIIVILEMSFILGFYHSLKKKSKRYFLYIPVVFIYSGILLAFGYYVMKTYNVVDKFTSDGTTYSSSIVTLSTNKVKDINDISGKVGILKDKDNIVGNTIPKDVIKSKKLDVKVSEYETYIELINALYDKKIDYAFLPTGYVVMFSTYEGQDFKSLDSETKIIYTAEKKVKTKQSKKANRLDKPFTILLMGVDSENESLANSSFNGDSLMLITFNPENLNATILSIPRDTYVPITCFANQAKSKITHAAWNGETCMINTIENFTGINIDYFVKINFKGVIKIVDTLGGVDVDVPYSFCESNSNRQFGNNTIYIDEGFQTLNGEQALAFSRNRHTWPEYCGKKYSNYVSNDFIRGQNQQTVVKAILNKIKQKGDLTTIYKLLDVVSNSMETNMTNNEIMSLYTIFKDVVTKSIGNNIDDVIGMQKLYLSGYGTMNIYDTTMRMYLYNYVLYQESLNDVVEAMKINLGLVEPKMIKEFSFDIDEEYEEKVIGQRSSGTPVNYAKNAQTKSNSSTNSSNKVNTSAGASSSSQKNTSVEEENEMVTVPDFTGMNVSEAKTAASKLGLLINTHGIDSGIVEKQDTAAGKKIEKGLTIGLTIKSKEADDSSNEETSTQGSIIEIEKNE